MEKSESNNFGESFPKKDLMDRRDDCRFHQFQHSKLLLNSTSFFSLSSTPTTSPFAVGKRPALSSRSCGSSSFPIISFGPLGIDVAMATSNRTRPLTRRYNAALLLLPDSRTSRIRTLSLRPMCLGSVGTRRRYCRRLHAEQRQGDITRTERKPERREPE